MGSVKGRGRWRELKKGRQEEIQNGGRREGIKETSMHARSKTQGQFKHGS